jgi:O-antigen/teichoic acid export membrane protein
VIRELRTLGRHALIYGSGFLLARAAGFLLVPLYTRFLTPADYGLIELLDLTAFFVGTFVALGMEQAVMKFYHAYEAPSDRHQVISTAVLFTCCSGLVMVALLVPLRGFFAEVVLGSRRYEGLFYIAFVTLLVTSLVSLLKITLRAQQRSVTFTVVSLAQTTVAIALNILFVAVLHKGPVGIFYSTLIGSTLFSAYLMWRILGETGISLDTVKLKRMLGYGIYFVPAGLASYVLNWTDRYFLRAYSTMDVIGLYALGYKIAMIVVLVVAVPFNQIWHSYLFEIEKQPNARDVYARVATYFVGALTAVALGIALLSREIVIVMAAPAFVEAHTVIPVLSAAMIFFCVDNVFQVGLLIKGESNRLSSARWIAAVANLGLNWLLIPRYGMMGAAIATLLSFMCSAVLILRKAQQTYPVPFEYRRYAQIAMAAAVTYAVSPLLPSSPLWLAIVTKAATWLLFPLLLFVTGFVRPEERNAIGRLSREGLGFLRLGDAGGAGSGAVGGGGG